MDTSVKYLSPTELLELSSDLVWSEICFRVLPDVNRMRQFKRELLRLSAEDRRKLYSKIGCNIWPSLAGLIDTIRADPKPKSSIWLRPPDKSDNIFHIE